MTCEILYNKCIAFETDDIFKEIQDPFSSYRSQMKTNVFKLMQDYGDLVTVEGSDVPETYIDRDNGTCCAIFSGTSQDLDVIEEYIKTRAIYQ